MTISKFGTCIGEKASLLMRISLQELRVLPKRGFLLDLLALGGCEAAPLSTSAVAASDASAASVKPEETHMLYGTNTLVIFYATFTSSYSYSYTPLGRGSARVTFSKH